MSHVWFYDIVLSKAEVTSYITQSAIHIFSARTANSIHNILIKYVAKIIFCVPEYAALYWIDTAYFKTYMTIKNQRSMKPANKNKRFC